MTGVVVLLIVSFTVNVFLSVLVFTLSSRGYYLLDRSHERTTEYTGELLDRLMARDFMEYKAATDTYVLSEPDEPTEPKLEVVHGPDRGGFGSRLGLRAYGEVEDEIKPEEEMQ